MLVGSFHLSNPARLAILLQFAIVYNALFCPSCNEMDFNFSYLVNPNALQQHALTDYLISDENKILQRPPANPSAIIGTDQNADDLDSLNPYLGNMNGSFADLADYLSFDQPSTTCIDFAPMNSNSIAPGSPYSFVQATLPQGSVLDIFALDTTAIQNTSLEINAPFQLSELGHIFENPQGTFDVTSISYPALFSTSEMYQDHPPHIFKSTQPTSSPLFSCDWSGCTKSKLDTSKKLETHVINIHIEPLRCGFSGCRRTEPFGRKGDLDRHIASVHKKERRLKCPSRNCSFHIKGFPRKDKLNEHLRTRGHGALKCEYRHCGKSTADFAPFMTEAELMSHFHDHHGNFECGIGSCANTSSAFTPRTLRSHVFRYHCSLLMDHENVCAIVYQIAERSQSNTCTITKDDFDGLEISDTCKDCVDESQHNTN